MIVLQHISFPSKKFNPEIEGFIKASDLTNTNLACDIEYLSFNDKCSLDFSTYYNAFSIEKWTKYTSIKDVKLHIEIKGDFTITLNNSFLNDSKQLITNIIKKESFSFKEKTSLDLNVEAIKGIVGFVLESNKAECVFYSGFYYIDGELPNDLPIFAIDICTYKREKYVNRNMNILKETVLDSDSILKNHFEVFIQDNGQSLELESKSEYIHVVPNKNTGGAGGFGRGMMEIIDSPNYIKFSHIIMMDDDIVFSYETLYRTFILVALLKEEYKNAWVGGAMVCIDKPKIQSEQFEKFAVTKNIPLYFRYDITELENVVKNEIEEDGNYFSWWYCVMPISVVRKDNLPLPIFIKRDDIEYGIRNANGQFINLNGISILHEDFNVKYLGYLEYYYWRNICILNAIHYPTFTARTLKKMLLKNLAINILRYRYNNSNLGLRGVEDFLKGIDWLKEEDPLQLHKYVMNYTYKPTPVLMNTLIPMELRNTEILDSKIVEDSKVNMKKLLLSWVMPAKGIKVVHAFRPPFNAFYRTKKIISYNQDSKTAFVTEKSYSLAINAFNNYLRICRLIDKKFKKVKKEYNERYREIVSYDFWKDYLSDKKDVKPLDTSTILYDEKPVYDKYLVRQTRLQDCVRYYGSLAYKFIGHCLSIFKPIQKNKISIYVHNRKGVTCNPKYVLEELLNTYGNNIKIVWITAFPETCEELKEKGVKVVKVNSKDHINEQLTSKIVITNDSFPSTVAIRKGQITLNTWHGGMNYKHIGYGYITFNDRFAKRVFKMRNFQPKYYLGGSGFFIDNTAESFKFNKKVFVESGLPRNDIFFRDNTGLKEKIMDMYNIPHDSKLVIYCPTFRNGFMDSSFDIDAAKLVEALEKRFDGKWVVLYRKHYFVSTTNKMDEHIIDVSEYPDMNELLAVADVAISDYSSALWDFANTKRPSFVYATDIKEYVDSDRAFAYPIEKWPYSIAETNDELYQNIINFNDKEFQEKLATHLKDCRMFDDGNASKRVVELLSKYIKAQKK